MLTPKKPKFSKQHRGRMCGQSKSKGLAFGEFGIQALEPTWLKSQQIEATRRSILRLSKKMGKLWVRPFPDKPITQRAAETRMGSGKGSTSFWVAVIKPGTILFEIKGLRKDLAYKVLKTSSYKLPMKTRIVVT